MYYNQCLQYHNHCGDVKTQMIVKLNIALHVACDVSWTTSCFVDSRFVYSCYDLQMLQIGTVDCIACRTNLLARGIVFPSFLQQALKNCLTDHLIFPYSRHDTFIFLYIRPGLNIKQTETTVMFELKMCIKLDCNE